MRERTTVYVIIAMAILVLAYISFFRGWGAHTQRPQAETQGCAMMRVRGSHGGSCSGTREEHDRGVRPGAAHCERQD
jgi:hypothetical protein